MSTVKQTNLYERFSPTERLSLVLEAMARGDEAEATRLGHSCPRKTYTGPDAAFDDRLHFAFDAVAIVAGDLRMLSAQVRTLHWAVAQVRELATLHHVTADMAFLEGVRCAQGLPPSPFFDREYYHPEEVGAGDLPAAPPPRPKDVSAEDEEEALESLGNGVCDRMRAVEEHAQYSTELILKVLSRVAEDRAVELLGVWEAFGRFSRERLGLTPERAMAACGRPVMEQLASALELCGDAKAVEETVAGFADALCAAWDRRFEGR